jgi:trimeric autotransporter adhesin
MPREYNWSVDIQRELPFNLVVQVGYTGNRGLGLLAQDNISRFPKDLFVPQYAAMMKKDVLSPNAGQTLESTVTGTTQQLGLLEYQYPYYGKVTVIGENAGRSTYHAGTFRIERRFSQGFSLLANYTRSRLLDDVGGADGQAAKNVQTVEPFHSVWGLSPSDRKHKLNVAFTYEFPIGQGKALLNSPTGLAGKLLDGVAGGWKLAGNYSHQSGTPITLTNSTGRLTNNTIKIPWTFPSYASSDHNLINPGFQDFTQILYGPSQPIIPGYTGYLDPTKIKNAAIFVLGDMQSNDDRYRQPSFNQVDLSLMKNFRITESRYIQIRAEAQNAFNIRGFGTIDATVLSPTYGLITSAGNTERQIQLSARFNF